MFVLRPPNRLCFGIFLTLLVIRLCAASGPVAAQSPSVPGQSTMSDPSLDPTAKDSPNATTTGNYNWKLPTLGGKQVWTDHRWWYDWRLQHNLLTDHWRVVDPDNVRHAWGTREACLNHLEKVIREMPAQPEPQEVVILLHGLMRSSDSMNSLRKHLQQNGYPIVVSFGYGSTRASIADHATAFREMVSHLPGRPRLYFAGHSMGNIVLRHAIGDWQRDGDTATLERIQRVVMLGPPNQGAAIARRLAKTGLFGIVTGKAGMQLGPAWEKLEQNLATPPCPFAIVMGNIENWGRVNPLIEGPSDLIVTVDEAHLDGVTDTLIVPELHSFLMDDEKVQTAVVHFFQQKSLQPESGVSQPEKP